MNRQPHHERDQAGGWLLLPLLWLAASFAAASSLPPGQVVVWGLGQVQPHVPPGLSNAVAVAAGFDRGLVLRRDGTLVAWGVNTYGEGSVPPGLTDVAAIAARNLHNLALRSNGTVVAWGYNGQGQTNVPPELTNVAAIAAGDYHSLALRSNRTVVAWGDDSYGQAGVSTELTNITAVAAGYRHSLALRGDGTVVAWGDNSHGQTSVPPGLTNVAAIAGGGFHSLSLLSNGTVVAWGDDSYGQAGVSTELTNITAVAAGYLHSLALRSNGRVVAWGDNGWGQTSVPSELANVAAIAAGFRHSLALRSGWPPTILVQPISQSVYIGHPFPLSVSVSSSEPLEYQWRFNGYDIPGATNSELTLPAVRYGDAGVYSVVVSNAFGSETSQAATLTVTGPPPNITTQPVSQPFHLGETVLLHALADGPGLLNYQWRLDGVSIAGATNTNLVISDATYGNRGAYTVMVRNPYGSVTSNPAQLFLPWEYEFRAPEGPLLWDFSGTYSSPLMTLRQDPDGFLVNSVGAQGGVSGNGAYVGISLSIPQPSGYWINFSSTHVEYILQDSCTATLQVSPSRTLLVGNESCVTVGQEWVLFLFSWVPYRNLTTNRSTTTLSQPLPEGVDGHWRLAMDVVPNGNQLAGRAFVALSGSNVISCEVLGTNSTVNKWVMELQSSRNHLTVVTTGPQMALQSLHGYVAGQSVDYDGPVRTTPLTLKINGSGNVTSLKDEPALVIGQDYTLHAAPRPGNLFSNWIVAGTVVTNRALRFTMSSNLVIAANFVPNPFLARKGSYISLFYDTNAPAHENAGLVRVTLRDKGAFSGALGQGAAKYRFSGQFDLALSAQKAVARRGTNEVVVRLQFTAGSDQLLGTVSNAQWFSELFGYRAGFSSRNPATNFQSAYNALLPGTEDPAIGPFGHSFGQVAVNRSGSVSFKGTLGDGCAAVQNVPLAANGQWPLYVGLYSGKGSVFGWLTLINTETNDLVGRVLWTRPDGVKGSLHPAGFTNEIEALGSRYVPPDPGTRVLDLTHAMVELGGGNLPALLTSAILLTDRNKVTIHEPNPQKLSFSLAISSGSFKGSFIHPVTGRSSALKGVLLQKHNLGAGFFPGTNQSGRVFLGEMESEPAPDPR